jgi:hypothetical protein
MSGPESRGATLGVRCVEYKALKPSPEQWALARLLRFQELPAHPTGTMVASP